MRRMIGKIALLIGMAVLLQSGLAFAQTHVQGYYRKDGTYVQPHMRSTPDSNPYNNYSYPGNYNPNTGQITGGDPDRYLQRYNHTSPSFGTGSGLAQPQPSDNPFLPRRQR